MPAADRVAYPPLPGTDEVFTPEFLEYIVAAHDKFAPAIADIRAKREAMIDRADPRACLANLPAPVRGELRRLDRAAPSRRAYPARHKKSPAPSQ